MHKMKTLKILLFVGIITSFVGCQNMGADKAIELSSIQDSVSYGYGVMLAENLKEIKDLDAEIVAAAVRETLNEKAQMDARLSSDIIAKGMSGEQLSFLIENTLEEPYSILL